MTPEQPIGTKAIRIWMCANPSFCTDPALSPEEEEDDVVCEDGCVEGAAARVGAVVAQRAVNTHQVKTVAGFNAVAEAQSWSACVRSDKS